MSLVQLRPVEYSSQSNSSSVPNGDELAGGHCELAYFTDLPEFHMNYCVEDSFLDLLSYIQRLAISATSTSPCSIVILPSPKLMAKQLSVDADNVRTALHVLTELGYYCEMGDDETPVLLSDVLIAA